MPIDDDPFILAALETLLQAVDGEPALTLLEDAAVDVLITDVLMPNLDGPSLLTRIRSGWPNCAASLPRIVVSSLEDEAILETALGVGCEWFRPKAIQGAHPDQVFINRVVRKRL